MSGIRREHGTSPLRKAAPLELDPLGRLLEPIDTSTLAGRRDRALLLLGFAAAVRRSELVALNVEDLEFAGRGPVYDFDGCRTADQRAVEAMLASVREPCTAQQFARGLGWTPTRTVEALQQLEASLGNTPRPL